MLFRSAATLLLLPGSASLRADVMAGAFGVGQFLLALVLARAAPSPLDSMGERA